MPRPQLAIILNAVSTIPAKFSLKFSDDDRLELQARVYLEQIFRRYRTKKMLHPTLASSRITAEQISQVLGNFETEEEHIQIKEVSFPDALEWLANEFSGFLRQTKRFPTKKAVRSIFRGA